MSRAVECSGSTLRPRRRRVQRRRGAVAWPTSRSARGFCL